MIELGQHLKLWWGMWSIDLVGVDQGLANHMAKAYTRECHGKNLQVGRGQGNLGVRGKMEGKAVEREVWFGAMGVEDHTIPIMVARFLVFVGKNLLCLMTCCPGIALATVLRCLCSA